MHLRIVTSFHAEQGRWCAAGLQNGHVHFLDSVREDSEDEAERRSEPAIEHASDAPGTSCYCTQLCGSVSGLNSSMSIESTNLERDHCFQARWQLCARQDTTNCPAVTGQLLMGNGATVASQEANASSSNGEDQDRREFKVRGKLQEHNDKLNLRLRIHQPDGKLFQVQKDF